ncbi:toll/interleukin-1 receptor domain-containing protein [Brucella sp. MAB-22]|uniref:toll/interleukin-1 receptor domain-containing protein n=1 Tax=Brucella TaxID=234 RepID=UPI000F68B156|nr:MULTISPECIES: toll/interleukin-1 receptor domain-containing protein [Brucella]RRY20579.1 toll/interleukin-1 receptor domain-containing protein [Brucella anthropi]UYT56876.1 toll/interleukin-1 receptor domain-containing protein [Brucella sp. MAB-22]
MQSVFFSYSHVDEALRDELEKHLAVLKRQGVIDTWHDRRIGAGQEIDQSINDRINTDDIILLLISSDFLASDYCYDREMTRALERHNAGEAVVIPVILRPCDWHTSPFGKLNATPPDGKPITKWPNRDDAFLEVTKAIREVLTKRPTRRNAVENSTLAVKGATERPLPLQVRSSNLRVAKSFSERDKDKFKYEAFEYIAHFFENSLAELESRNPDIETHFRRIDGARFFAGIYQNGNTRSKCTIFIGDSFGNGICYVDGETTQNNTMNESLHVEADENSMFFRSMGMFSRQRENKLTFDGAAELYWANLIEPIQRNW